ncbi:DUF2798 domain-containing protein [Roseibium alexandrii]|uniref:DUF2798 domain-containing protein n=1 Tax=Roseibium alexandrii (strain DSM 17067 / NCIMB 14079 / DFL-11) TaxID=244592 RepID=A0A5E8GXL8_ROSAD|nr:DUF2798 domain-containing protein [Roseibium alexandrii]EEE43734.1 Protein of unknown function (DUF2798) [Roseibium alexandrii DFL-11]
MHPKFAPYLFGAMLSGSMSFLVSGIATFRAVGPHAEFFSFWIESWLFAWAVAFPAVLVLAPIVREIVAKLVKQPEE